jgi:methionyl-tRNA formyltransferase
MTWQVLEGKRKIPICLLEASERVDAGLVYLRSEILLSGTELVADLRKKQASATFQLLRDFLTRYPFSVSEGKVQKGEPSYYPRRKPVDSKIDPNKTIRELFPLLQVVDNERYPAYFELNGKRFLLKIEADEQEEKK